MVRKHIVLISLFFIISFLFESCERTDLEEINDAIDSEELCVFTLQSLPSDISDTMKKYADAFLSMYNSSKEKEAFLFFTDPHLMGENNIFNNSNHQNLNRYFSPVKGLYDALDLKVCLCGGDWLNSGDYQDIAMLKLMYIDQQMKLWFPGYYKMMGNHDTNYQGVVSLVDPSRGDLTKTFINDIYFGNYGKAYYSFKGNNTRFLILDSGLDLTPIMDEYRWEQIAWLGNQLQNNTETHLVIGAHLFYLGQVKDSIITPFASEITSLCNAFNTRSMYNGNGIEFDFAEVHGTIHFMLSGHNHIDYSTISNGIPVIGTSRFVKSGLSTFDLCLIDYDHYRLQMFRVGNGISRTFNIISLPY